MRAVIRRTVHFLETAHFGGTEQVLVYLLAGLDRRRWHPVLLHHPEPGLEPLLTAARELGVELAEIPRLDGRRAVTGIPPLVRKLRSDRPAVFHAHLHWPLACTGGLAAAAVAGIPAVLATAHLVDDVPHGPSIYARQRVLASAVDHTLAVSRDVAQRLRGRFRLPPSKISVVHNGIDVGRFERPGRTSQPPQKDAAGRPTVLTAARLYAQKGHAYLLEAAVLVPEARFLLAGDGPDREALEARAAELGLSDRVVFLGYRRDVPELLAGCDLFVLPSLFEGLPLAVLEAMAAGKPVIASAIGGVDEVITHGETGILVSPAVPAALAEGIRTLLANSALAQRLAAAARVRVARDFSAEAMVHSVTEIYDELLSRPGKAAWRI